MAADLLHLIRLASTVPAEFFISGVWQGLLLVVAAWLGLKVLPRVAPRTRFVLWMIVFILSALVPLASLLDVRPIPSSASTRGALSVAHLQAGWAVAIAALWAAASLFSLARLFLNGCRLRVLAKSSTPLPAEMIEEGLRILLAEANSRPVELRLSAEVDSPIVIGFFRPAILIPEWLAKKLTRSELKQVVLHELAHLGRRDDWTNLLQQLLRALFPLNPALLWADRELSREREMACDDAVLDAEITPREYATCLTRLAEKRMLRRAESLAPGAWRRRSELSERVHRILKRKCGGDLLSSRPAVAAFLLVFLSAGAILARCPQIVTFTAADQLAELPVEAQVPALAPASLREQAVHPARFVQASLRTVVPSHKNVKHPPARHAVLRHRAASVRVREVRMLNISQAAARTLPPQIVWSVWRPSFSISTVTILGGDFFAQQITSGPSRGAGSSATWIVFQL